MSRPTQQDEGGVTYVSPLRLATPYLIAAWLVVFWFRFFLSVLPGVGDGTLDRVFFLTRVPELLWAAFFPDQTQNSPIAWSNLTQRVPILCYAAFILASAYAVGCLLLRGLKLNALLDFPSHTAFAGSLGLGAVSLVTLDLGYFGFLSRSLFAVLLLIPILIEIYFFLNGNRINRNDDETDQGKLFWVVLAGCCIFLVLMLLGAMLPSIDFDVKEYHLGGPKEYFLAGHIHFLPHNVYTSFPFLTEMLSLYGMVLTGDWFTGALVGKTVLMSFAPLTALGVFAVGKRVASPTAGMLGALVYLSTPWTYRISIIAYTEGAMCCYVILSLLALLIWMKQLRNADHSHTTMRSLSLLSGLLAGCSIATKYPGMVMVAIPVALALLVMVVVHKTSLKQSVQMAGCYILGGTIAFGPWMIKNSIETGNPVYPLMYSVFGGEDWDEELNEKWKAGHARPSPLFKSPMKMFEELKKNVLDVATRSVWQSPMMFGLLPLAFFWKRKDCTFWLIVGTAATLLLVWYSLTHLIDRFWLPVLPVIAVLSGIAWLNVHDYFRSEQHRHSLSHLLIGKVITGLFIVTLIFNFAFMTTEACGYNVYLIDYQAARERVKPLSLQIAESVLSDGERVLFVGDAMVFDADYEYRYNTVFDYSLLETWTATKTGADEWKLHSADEINNKFQEEGITHLLINWQELLRYRTTYGYTDFVSPQRIEELNNLWAFVEVPLPDQYNLKDWESLSENEQQEIEIWAPELKQRTRSGKLAMKKYQLYELKHRD